MKRILIVSLLSLVVASCARQQVIATAIPTNTFPSTATNTIQTKPANTSTLTSAPDATATNLLLSDGLILLGPNHYTFLIWSVSFSLPEDWDINNRLNMSPVGTGATLQAGRELYIFYRNNRTDNDPKNDYPSMAIFFERVPSQVDVKTYSEELMARGHGASILVNETIDPKELGFALESALAYKTSSVLDGVEHTQYMIHALYQTIGIEIILDSDSISFANFDTDFSFFLKNLAFE